MKAKDQAQAYFIYRAYARVRPAVAMEVVALKAAAPANKGKAIRNAPNAMPHTACQNM